MQKEGINKSHSRISLSGISALEKKVDGTPDYKFRGWKQAVINEVSSPRNVVGDLRLTLPCNKKDFSLFNTTQSAEDSRQRHSGMTAFFGFTLIELLVVVLIIGILAAVALPQYQKAVERTKSAEAVIILKSVYQAFEEYYLANGTWPTSFADLSVTPPWTGTTPWYPGGDSKDVLSNDTWSLMLVATNAYQGLTIGKLAGKYKGGGFAIWHKYYSPMPSSTIVCAEKIADIETSGDYCQKVMQSGKVFITGGTLRYYKMP